MYLSNNLYFRRYSDVVAPSSQHDRLKIYTIPVFHLAIFVMRVLQKRTYVVICTSLFRLFSGELLPPEIHVKVAISH